MIAPRRPLRLACMAPPRAAARARAGWPPPPLRWRRLAAAAAGCGVPGRLASCVVKLQQHLHLRFGPVNVPFWPGPAAHLPWRAAPAAGPGQPRVVARGERRTWAVMPSAGLSATGRSAAPGQPWAAPAVLARPAPPAPASRAQWAQVRASAPIAGPGADGVSAAAPTLAPASPGRRRPRAQAGRLGELAKRSGAQAPGMGAARLALRAPAGAIPPARAGRPMRRAPPPVLRPARPAATEARPAAPRAPVPTGLARREPAGRAELPPFISAPPAALEWRRQAQGGTTAPDPAPWVQGRAPVPVARAGADSRAAAVAPPAAAGMAPGFPALDLAAADRLAEDVVRRVERRLRIERERRGL